MIDPLGDAMPTVAKVSQRGWKKELLRWSAFSILAAIVGFGIGNSLLVVSGEKEPSKAAPQHFPLPGNYSPTNWGRSIKKATASVLRLKILSGNSRQERTASGIVISKEGYIISSYHSVAQARAISAMDQEGHRAKLKLIGADPVIDIAVLTFEDPNQSWHPQPIDLADSNQVQVGDIALVIGYPFGLGITASQGIVSALERDAGTPWVGMIQTDAEVNPGSSGGALLNSEGRLIGMTTSLLSNSTHGQFSGIGFALPSQLLAQVVEEIILHGKIRPKWIGIVGQPGAIRNRLVSGGAMHPGIYVAGVTSPALEAGIRKGDWLVEIDGAPATFNNWRLRLRTLTASPSVSVLVLRQNSQLFQTEISHEVFRGI